MNAQHKHMHISPWVIAFTVMIATFMEVLDTSVANVAMPHIAGNLSATVEETTWVLTSYLVANAVVLPLGGYLSSLMGRKRFYLTCVTLFTVASALCGLAPSLGWLIFFRVLQGLGGGGLQPISQAIMVETFPHEKRGMAMAVYGMGVVFAPIIGPVLGGWITDNYSWNWIFLINIPVGLIAILLNSALLHDPPTLKRISIKEGARFDYMGIGFLTLGLASLEIVLDEGQRKDWFSSNFIIFFAIIAVVALISTIVMELRKPDPIIDLRLLKNGNFAVAALMLFILGFVLYGSMALLPIFLQTLLGYTASLSGWVLSPGGVAILVMMPVVAVLLKHVQPRFLIATGFIICAGGLFMMAGFNLQVDYKSAVVARMIQSLGLAFLFVPMNVMAFQNVSPSRTNYATGLLNLLRNIGGSTGIALVNTVLSRRSQFHQATLVANMHPASTSFQGFLAGAGQKFVAHGNSMADATKKSMGLAYGTLVRQSTMMAFVDVFWIMGVLCLALLPLLLFIRKQKHPAPIDASAAMH